PLLVVAASKDDEDAARILRAGAEDFIVGQRIAGLGEAVRNALRRREMRRHSDRRTELALRASEERFRAIFNQAAVGLAHVGIDGRYVLVNKKLCEIFGYSAEELLQKTVWEISHPDDREAATPARQRLFAGEVDTSSVEKRYLRKDGSAVWVNLVISLVRNAAGKPEYDVAAYEDITQRKLVEEALKDSESRHRAVIENAAEGMIIHDASGRVVSTNSSAELILGRRKDELIGKSPVALDFDIVREDGTPWPAEMRPVTVTLKTGTPQSNVVMGQRRSDGSMTWLSLNVRPLGGSDGQPGSGVVVSFTDITERRSFEEKLRYLAQNDALTGLPNRALLLDRLGQAITRATRRGTLIGVMLVDLDRFKEINDSLGHSAGDMVLKEVASRIRRALRDTDTVARLGGDEFCIVLEECESREKVAIAAAKLRGVLDEPIATESHEMFTGASIGLAVFLDDGDSIEGLVKHDDSAMYDAKREGGNTYRFYRRELHSRPAEQIGLATALRRAVERNELVLHYQPQMDIASGQPVGIEALLLWRHPELGVLPPTRFIHIAEDTGLIVPIGEWVLKTACAEAKAWQQAGLPELFIAVNLSARQFRDAQLASKVAATLAMTGLDPRFLELEITESVIMSETGHTVNMLTRLAQLGVRVSIDDFGTGYSSLAYLKRFPVHKLKIDRTFVRDIQSDRDDAAIVQAIITLAKTLELGVVAEGVETGEQLAFLANLGCGQYQGYYFSRPLPPKELLELLRSKFPAFK
ncbi:MAG TPA: EAL domain-containing protein, partial [Burkholderiales bacterium]